MKSILKKALFLLTAIGIYPFLVMLIIASSPVFAFVLLKEAVRVFNDVVSTMFNNRRNG